LNYALIGYGRMGREVDARAAARGHSRVGILDPQQKGSDPEERALERANVAFEFTLPDAAETNVRRALGAGDSVVCGTTGWEPPPGLGELAAAHGAGFVLAPNFAIGVNLFFRVVGEAARVYGGLGLHDAFVHEAHHRGKADAPSGTARRLASIVVEADPHLESVLEGHPSGRLPAGCLQVVSTRAGAEAGTHRVGFDGPHDLITLEHRARGRAGLALGAVLAAEWLEGRRGRFEFDEVIDALVRGELGAEGDDGG
jgi:4-hydroxy-tetrahydrodipicolinate reductase